MLFVYFAMLEDPSDKLLFEEFYDKFYDTIYYICKEHLHTKELSEDCAHEVLIFFAKEFRSISHDFSDTQLKAYVKLVAKCKAVDMYRKEKKFYENKIETDIEELYDIPTDEFNIYTELQLKEAFDNMPEEYRFVCYLKYVHQLSSEEIGRLLDISAPLVRKRCMQGKQFLKKYLKGEYR